MRCTPLQRVALTAQGRAAFAAPFFDAGGTESSVSGLRINTGGFMKAPKMTTTDTFRYRGYELVPQRQWASWCVGIYATRPDFPSCRDLFCGPWHPERKTLWPRQSRASTTFCHGRDN